MKELSIEEKAKRYDKAIERAESIYNETAIPSATTKGICTYIFPELKEGDGEKWIPKEIAKYLKEKGDFRSCWLAWLEKQCEQKIKTPEESLGIDSDTYNKIVDECIYGEQKPAWSEEDERNLQGIIDEIEANKNHAPDYDVATYNRFLSWLKSLKERYTWKPSDEQMRTLEHYMHTLVCTKYKEILFGLYSDLKELRGE